MIWKVLMNLHLVDSHVFWKSTNIFNSKYILQKTKSSYLSSTKDWRWHDTIRCYVCLAIFNTTHELTRHEIELNEFGFMINVFCA